MNKILQRYLASSFIGPFVISSLFFVSFLLTFQLFRIIRIVIDKSISGDVILNLIMHIAISFIPIAIPIAALFSIIFALNKLSEDSEIIAMRSFGIKKWDLFFPFLTLGIVISIALFSLSRNIIPYSKTQFKNTIVKLTSSGMLSDIKAEQFFTDIPGITLFAQKVSDEGKVMEDVFIRQQQGDVEKIIMARSGRLVKQVSDNWGVIPALRLYLKDGNITHTEKRNDVVEKILFSEYDFPVLSKGLVPSFVTKDSMRSNSELQKLIDDGRTEKRKDVPFYKAMMELYSRYNNSLLVIVFIFLGFSLGIKRGRGKARNTSGLAILTLIIYYCVFFFGVSFAKKGNINPAIAVFLPTIITFILSIRFFKRLDWNS